MKKSNRSKGFTLVEVLIVVVIMAILAATIIPQFSDSTKDAKVSSAKFNLHTIRSQIELYKSQHDGKMPTAGMAELTIKTNTDGTTTGTPAYGPYLELIPTNSFNGSNTVAAAAANPPTAVVAGAGWLYHAASGKVWVNDTTIPFADQ